MASNEIYRGAKKNLKADGKRSGQTIDPGPYEAIVQGHVEGSRMGQLLVSIPELSGQVDDAFAGKESDQIVVSYASPFYGTTFGSDQGLNPDGATTSGQSYGMWCVPPDVGNKVLVTFVAGDMQRGYWFACIYDSPNHHMVPGNGRNIGGAGNTKPPGGALDSYLSKDSVSPVGEYNISNADAFTADGLVNSDRYAHPSLTMGLVIQGLDKDPVRGAISSSSMREAPSNVYGISTPGRRGTKGDQVAGNKDIVYFRQGGHSFVMDDGAEDGTDQLMRLRTSGGHQILMNDTEEILYIASSSGNQWLEFSASGAINVYAGAGFNLRSGGAINMHSDSSIVMCAPHIKLDALPNINSIRGPNGGLNAGAALGIIPSISINSAGTFSTSSLLTTTIKSDAAMSLGALGATSINTGAILNISAVGALNIAAGGLLKMGAGGAVSIDGPMLNLNCLPSVPTVLPPFPAVPPIPNFLDDTTWVGNQWLPGATKITTTCRVVPAHEPWDRTKSGGNKMVGLAVGVAQMLAGGGGISPAVDIASSII